MPIDWSEVDPVRLKSSMRNIRDIEKYRVETPVAGLLEKCSSETIGIGGLRQLYTYRNEPFLLVTDENARDNVPVSVASVMAEKLDIPGMVVDLSVYTKEAILAEMDLSTPGYPKFRDVEARLPYRSLRRELAGKGTLKGLAAFIMSSLDTIYFQDSTPYARTVRGFDPNTQMDRDALVCDPDTGIRCAPLNEETFKLLDNSQDWLSFLARAINTERVKVIDLDCILYDRERSMPLLLAEVKHLGGYWRLTKEVGDTLGVPSGCIRFYELRGETKFEVEGFGLADEERKPLSADELVAFITEQVQAASRYA